MTKLPKVSIVIPVYNESRQIQGCLDSISSQTVAPDEIIIVDNNCTDNTIAIAKKHPLVRVITESKQGRGHARSAGFSAVHSEIIGRIDADSRLDKRWVERVKQRFSEDSDLTGLTGIGNTSFIPGVQFIKTTLFSRSYYWYVHAAFHTITMWGATMAIRKSAWDDVASRVCNDDMRVHEDQDVSLWIAANGGKIEQDNSMKITTSGQTFRYLPKVLSYRRLFLSTMKLHTENGNLGNLTFNKLSFWTTFAGWVWALLLGVLIFVFITLMFPVDYIIVRKLNSSDWLE